MVKLSQLYNSSRWSENLLVIKSILLICRKYFWIFCSWSQASTVSVVPNLIVKDMVRKSISNLNNGKAAWPLGLMPKVISLPEKEVEIDMIVNIGNQTIMTPLEIRIIYWPVIVFSKSQYYCQSWGGKTFLFLSHLTIFMASVPFSF